MKPSLSLIGAVLVVVAASIGATADDALAPGTRLCLHPVHLPTVIPEDGERRPVIERQLEAALTAADFRVVGSEDVARVSKAVFEAGEGWVDPTTGLRVESLFQDYRARLARALREELGCEMRVSAGVVPVRAPFVNGIAQWDGRHEQMITTGRMVLQTLGGVSESGWVAALSLWLQVTDLEGHDVAFRSGGIETLVQLGVAVDRDLLPADVWLSDAMNLAAAIELALGPAGKDLREAGAPTGWRAERAP